MRRLKLLLTAHFAGGLAPLKRRQDRRTPKLAGGGLLRGWGWVCRCWRRSWSCGGAARATGCAHGSLVTELLLALEIFVEAPLEDLAETFNVSRERIRQIEARAFEKVRKAVKNLIPKAPALEAWGA